MEKEVAVVGGDVAVSISTTMVMMIQRCGGGGDRISMYIYIYISKSINLTIWKNKEVAEKKEKEEVNSCLWRWEKKDFLFMQGGERRI